MSIADRVKVLAEVTLADDWSVLKKTQLSWRRSDGSWQVSWRETYDRGDGAVILPYDVERRTVLLIQQFRYPAFKAGYDSLMIEAAAGLLDEASPDDRIREEASEELGLRIGKAERVFESFMSPGSVTERLHFFVAPYRAEDRVSEGGGLAHEGEDIHVLELDVDEAMEMVRDGRICDGKTIMLLQHAALNLFPRVQAAG